MGVELSEHSGRVTAPGIEHHYSAEGAGRVLNFSGAHVRRLVANGTLRGIKLGPRSLRIPASELQAFLTAGGVK